LRSKPDIVLVSHVLVPAIDPATPFCLSADGVTGVLRKRLGFKGVILTDDIAMGALAERGHTPAEAAVLALRAGCDMVMTSDPGIRGVVNAIVAEATQDDRFRTRLDEAVSRVIAMKLRVGFLPQSQTEAPKPSDSQFDADAYRAAREAGDKIVASMQGGKDAKK
jgi:beta-N-acetylhexosaminidase